jgi:glutamine cyclotransferase
LPVYGYRVVATYPHDPDAFTQGLVYFEGLFYESTGLHGRSSLRRVELETGRVLKLHSLPPELFGEGITLFKDRIIQLTWRSQVGFVYDRESFAVWRRFRYPIEGWGITHDGKRLIVSDGSSTLYLWNPDTLVETGRIPVTDRGSPVAHLNELEYIGREIWANVWQTDRIARVSPETGRVTAWIDLAGLLGEEDRRGVDVLNGIAYDSAGDRIFVTGKLWPKIFEIRLVSRDDAGGPVPPITKQPAPESPSTPPSSRP